MTAFGWLGDATETSLRSALSVVGPQLAGLPLRMRPVLMLSDPLWWSSSAVIDESYTFKARASRRSGVLRARTRRSARVPRAR